jgi:transposase InsO family protein
MRNELSDRQQAIRMRLAGDSVSLICQSLHRSPTWFHKWWQRYLATGGEGLYDLTRTRHAIVNRTPAHIERAILAIRRRLAARATPQTRYALLGAPTIAQELKNLGFTPVPTMRTIERVLQRAHLTSPRLRLAHHLPRSEYPGPHATDSNQVHQVDLVGPRYLTGDKTKYYFFICKDAFDQAVYAEFHAGNAAEQVLSFLISAWQHLGLPQQVQFDNGRQFYAPGRYARSLNRVIRLTLRLGVQPVFIPEGQPARNGSVENFNGWFQPLLLRQNFPNACAVRRELRRLLTAANEQHVHQALGFKTPMQFRRTKRLRMLPANFAINLNKISVSVGKILFIRWVGVTGFVDILGQSVRVGRRFRYHYVKVLLETHPQRLKIYCNARLIKSCAFKLRIP